MIKKINISRQNMQLFFGIMLSIFVLVQSTQFAPITVDNQEQSDQEEAEGEQSSTVSQAKAITNSGTQINVAFDSYLLGEVTFQKETDDKKSVYQQLIPKANKAIRVLLRKIISPNAP